MGYISKQSFNYRIALCSPFFGSTANMKNLKVKGGNLSFSEGNTKKLQEYQRRTSTQRVVLLPNEVPMPRRC